MCCPWDFSLSISADAGRFQYNTYNENIIWAEYNGAAYGPELDTIDDSYCLFYYLMKNDDFYNHTKEYYVSTMYPMLNEDYINSIEIIFINNYNSIFNNYILNYSETIDSLDNIKDIIWSKYYDIYNFMYKRKDVLLSEYSAMAEPPYPLI